MNLLRQIEIARNMMHKSASKYGITHTATLAWSQVLDDLLNLYERERRA